MARDPPSLLAGSELRDLSFTPTAIHDASVTIVHPQLRDLILPLHRGRVLFPHMTNIDEMIWTPEEEVEDDDCDMKDGVGMPGGAGMSGRKTNTPEIRPFAKLTFAPNCLTTSRGVLAAGGQHGELYICNLPSLSPSSPSSASRPSSDPTYRSVRPFHISQTLPTRSINNSILILPTWGPAWHALAERKRLGYIGRGSRRWAEQEGEGEGEGWAEGGYWKRKGWYDDDVELEQARCERGKRRGTLEWDSDAMDLDEDEEEGEGEEEEEEDDEMEDLESTSPRSPATYPNTVPFFHPPRIPNLPPSPINITAPASPSLRRASAAAYDYDRQRALSFSQRQRAGPVRQSFSSFTSTPADVGGLQIVSSLPHSAFSAQGEGGRGLARRASIHKNHRPSLSNYDARIRPRPSISASGRRCAIDAMPVEPRILISNNDQTVKVFSLRATPDATSRSTTTAGAIASANVNAGYRSDIDHDTRLDDSLTPAQRRQRDLATMDRVLNSISRQVLPPVPAFYGGRLGRDTSAANYTSHNHTQSGARGTAASSASSTASPPSRANRRTSMGMNLDLSNMPMGDSDIRTAIEEEREEERKLNRVGGARFKTAINHSSISPDLSMMVSVGDSIDVYLFQVLQGGQEFRKIRTLKAATDSGFSTAWSKDGRKFAVASQDGQVTVWDHRSTHPLAIFHTSHEPASHSHTYPTSPHSSTYSSTSFSADLARARIGLGSGMPVGDDGMGMVLVDPGSGEVRPGSSNSGREAARVVKFSPEGSGRDLMVFSEEHSHIHMIDAKTFNSHVVLPVPCNPTATSPSSSPAGPTSLRYSTTSATTGTANARRDMCGQSWGIAGVAFDPTGEWLYSGTESTVVEWDLRRFGGGEGGTWGMA